MVWTLPTVKVFSLLHTFKYSTMYKGVKKTLIAQNCLKVLNVRSLATLIPLSQIPLMGSLVPITSGHRCTVSLKSCLVCVAFNSFLIYTSQRAIQKINKTIPQTQRSFMYSTTWSRLLSQSPILFTSFRSGEPLLSSPAITKTDFNARSPKS